ncbi:MAG TPA: nucleotide exchange factor GrpE [Pyrinomonadaceae bacterium]|nr:nucleotide exchange factor GrpE [Pyrinomonadaceae bacterium]
MMNKNRRTSSRIPVRFVDDEAKRATPPSASDADEGEGRTTDGGLTPEELGRESSYEGETEMQRRIDRGGAQEGDSPSEADDADTAGGPNVSDMPERKGDQDTNPTHRQSDDDAPEASSREAAPSQGAKGSGPALAELVATRAELKRVETELQKLLSDRQELTDAAARRQADFENYRKRVERERGEAYNRLVGEVVSKLLPVMDNLRRALDAEANIQSQESEEFRHFLQGIELISKQLNGVLESLGVSPVPTVGERFDPHIHEAVATEETDRYEPDTVTAELVRGYRVGDKLIRPAMVRVAVRQ